MFQANHLNKPTYTDLVKWILNKPYVNGVTLRDKNLSLKCCHGLEHKEDYQLIIYISKEVL